MCACVRVVCVCCICVNVRANGFITVIERYHDQSYTGLFHYSFEGGKIGTQKRRNFGYNYMYSVIIINAYLTKENFNQF